MSSKKAGEKATSGEGAVALTRSARVALAAIFLLYVILAVLYSYATRLKWGPDEPAHFVYVQSLALDFRLPEMQKDAALYVPGHALSHQRQHPPLYYALAAIPYRLFAGLPTDAAWLRLRWFSILIGLGALALEWRLVRLLFPKDLTICFASLATLAFLPMFTYITSVVNNDGLAILLFAATAYQWCRILSGKADLANLILAGALAGLAILTKESALALLPGLIVVAAATRPAGAGRLWLRRLGRTLAALAAAGVVCGGWFANNVATYGSPTVYAYLRPAYQSLAEALSYPFGTSGKVGLFAALGIAADNTFKFLWLPWWTVEQQKVIPEFTYKVGMALLSLAAFCGLMLALMDRCKRKAGLSALQAQALGLMLLTVLALIGGIVRYLLFIDYTAVQAGRYLIVVWPLLSIMGVVGLATLLKGPRARAVGLAILVVLWLAGNLGVLWLDYLTYHA